MIEDKTKEPQTAEPAQQPPKKRGQKLRSLWAQFQCMQLLRRHRFRRRTQHHVNHFSQKLLQNRLVLIVGEALYALGFSAEYAFVRVGRTVCRGVSGALLWVRSLRHTIVSMAFPGAAQMVRDLFGPIVLFFRGMGSLLVHAHRVRKEKGFGAAVKDSVHYLVGGVRRNVRTLPRMAMYILPVLALAGMVTVVQNTIRQPYALEVQVNGQTVGYVANEDVFNSAKEAVQERINYAGTDENTKWTVEPTYTISVAHRVLDENEMANAILKSSSDQISEGTALYLDGELTAVCSDGTALQSYLSSLLEPYENPEDPNVTVGFNKEVTLENGIYFNESFQQENDVESMLSGVQQQEKIYTVQTGDTRPGDIKYKDINGDGKIDEYDKVPIGWGSVPEIMYGFGFSVGWKNLSLTAMFQGAAHVDAMLSGEGVLPFSQGSSRGNLLSNITDRWTEENPRQNAFYPRLSIGNINMNYEESTWWLKDTDYLRLKNIELSYRLPDHWMKRIHLDNARIFIQGVNLLTFSSFKIWDVELGDGRGARYPNIASVSLGVNFNF